MRTVSQKELKEILDKHKKWLNGKGGERADLCDAYLRGANLQLADLQLANLRNVNLRGANLQDADLQEADLRGADLHGAILRKAYLRDTNLQRANLQDSCLSYAWLQHANLHGVNLCNAELIHTNLQNSDLSNADLSYADLQYADLSEANLQDTKLLKTILYKANVEYITRQWLVIADHIGSRKAKTLYFADIDTVRCGCWYSGTGGTLNEFKARINRVYSADSKDRFCQYHRIEYLSAIKMFKSMREAYLKEAEKEKRQ